MVRIEPQRLGAGSDPGPTAPDLLDLVPHRVSSNSPRISESPHVASAPPTSSPTPAAAPSSNPDLHLNRRDGALSAALTITGSSTGPLGDTHVRGRGCPTRSGSTPTRSPGGHSHPRAGGSGRPDPASTPAGRYRLAVQTGGRPATCSSGCGHPGQTRPSFGLGRHHQTQPPSDGRGSSQPPHPLITRQVSTAPAVRPGTGGAKLPTLSAARWCISRQR